MRPCAENDLSAKAALNGASFITSGRKGVAFTLHKHAMLWAMKAIQEMEKISIEKHFTEMGHRFPQWLDPLSPLNRWNLILNKGHYHLKSGNCFSEKRPLSSQAGALFIQQEESGGPRIPRPPSSCVYEWGELTFEVGWVKIEDWASWLQMSGRWVDSK